VTWLVLIILAVGTLTMKVLGATLFTKRPIPARLAGVVKSLPVAIYPALVASATLGSDSGGVHVDARLIATAAVLVLVILFRRRNVFGFAMIVGAAVTAVLRILMR
jgi:branched-subunit amino acid transport protein